MEEEKAVAYYEELTRKGEGAARFKQGLGFSTTDTSAPSRGAALASRSSFLSNFVKSSGPEQSSKFEKQAQLESIQNKLKKKPRDDLSSKVSERDSGQRRRSRSRDRYRDRDRHRSRRSRSRSRSRDKYRSRDRDKRKSRSRSRSVSPRRDRRSERRKRSRSSSPRGRRKENSRSRDVDYKSEGKERKGDGDFSQLIPGYEKMAPAERVKARMKFQLNETDKNDSNRGMGWERFEFDKDAPLDDEEIEAVEDDVALVKHIGQSFRFSAVEARNEERLKAAHDEAMFGAPSLKGATVSDSDAEVDSREKESNKTEEVAAGLLSEKVLAKQQGSWRDRARKL